MSNESCKNSLSKSIYDKPIKFSTFKRFNSHSENENTSNKQKLYTENMSSSSLLNFNFFNEINSPFSNSEKELISKKTKNAFSNNSNYISSLLTNVNEEDDYDVKNKSQNFVNEYSQNEDKNDNGNIFDILSKHLNYQSNDSELNDSFDNENEKNIENYNNNNIKNNNINDNNNEINDNNNDINDNNNVINDDKINNENEKNESNNIEDKLKFNDYNELNQEDKIILNNFLNLAKEQSSCRFLQQKINSQQYLVKYIFSLITQNINELIIHPYGNYLIQNIFFYLSEDQISKFVNLIKGNLLNISMNFYGTRVIQKLIDFIHNQNTMLNLLNGYNNYSIIANDIFASHIIIKLLSFKQMYINSFIYEKINDDLVEISKNRHGCCVIKKILESKSSFNDTIINNIINNAMKLIIDQYGHYTILYIIQSDLRTYKQKLIMNIIPNFIHLSIQIYSSTVLEKCFEFCEDDIKNILYQCLGNVTTMKILICDKYGNYVIQKAILKTPNDNIRYYLFRIISSIINDIKNDNFGRQFYVKLCKNYPIFKKFISSSKIIK